MNFCEYCKILTTYVFAYFTCICKYLIEFNNYGCNICFEIMNHFL